VSTPPLADGGEKREAFREYLKLFKFTAKETIERMEMAKQAESGTVDQQIHQDILNTRLAPDLSEMSSLIYSAILMFNKDPNMLPYNREDILEAQLTLDEVTAMLRNAGANVQFTRTDATF
jgi:predicted 3-demethylubiquinone-9 3-methyltransferase (glyoxalase superfamily)